MLSTLKDSEWVALDDLSALWSERVPGAAGAPSQSAAARAKERGRRGASAAPRGSAAVEALLLGAAYPLGLVRAAEQDVTHKRLVQLSPLGRYVLALGATPPPRPAFDRFLLVQPNFEMIAYRQGLTPQLVGALSRFAWWSQIGSAVELKLTRESIVHGLGGGLSAEAILETLNEHNQRALPPGVVNAVKNWASRREWLSFYTSATLIEFGSEPERDSFLSSWQSNDGILPVAVGERFLLVENERAVPFDRLRLTSSRDYRRPAEVCVKVESDGVTLALDLARSDLLVNAELLRFADMLPAEPRVSDDTKALAVRRFRVTAASLARGLGRGMSHPDLGGWFQARTGNPIPPAIELLLAARSPRLASLKATREVVVTLPTVVLLDGLIQHPATGPLLGERLRPVFSHGAGRSNRSAAKGAQRTGHQAGDRVTWRTVRPLRPKNCRGWSGSTDPGLRLGGRGSGRAGKTSGRAWAGGPRHLAHQRRVCDLRPFRLSSGPSASSRLPPHPAYGHLLPKGSDFLG